MSKAIINFEELDCWKEARSLVKMIYQATNSTLFIKDYGLKDQIQRAAISVMANIAEGFENISNQEFVRFLGYSLRSCSEVRSHLYAALDIGYVSQEMFNEVTSQAQKCNNYIKAFLKYLKVNNIVGDS